MDQGRNLFEDVVGEESLILGKILCQPGLVRICNDVRRCVDGGRADLLPQQLGLHRSDVLGPEHSGRGHLVISGTVSSGREDVSLGVHTGIASSTVVLGHISVDGVGLHLVNGLGFLFQVLLGFLDHLRIHGDLHQRHPSDLTSAGDSKTEVNQVDVTGLGKVLDERILHLESLALLDGDKPDVHLIQVVTVNAEENVPDGLLNPGVGGLAVDDHQLAVTLLGVGLGMPDLTLGSVAERTLLIVGVVVVVLALPDLPALGAGDSELLVGELDGHALLIIGEHHLDEGRLLLALGLGLDLNPVDVVEFLFHGSVSFRWRRR